MKYTLLVVAIATLLSCSTDYKKFQVPENAAMSSLHIPLYKDTADIRNGSAFRKLPPGTQVYFTGDTIIDTYTTFVKIVWGDSSAYTNAHLLMPKGHWAVVRATNNHGIIEFYDNSDLDEVVDNYNRDWDLMVVGEFNNTSVPVLYETTEMPGLIGYVPKELVHDDSLDVAFYNDYTRNTADSTDFTELDLYKWRTAFDGYEEDGGFNDTDYGDPGVTFEGYEQFVKERNWSLAEDSPIPEEQYPGSLRKYFIFDDSTELDAEGYSVLNGFASGPSDQGNKMVVGVGFVFVPNRTMDVQIDILTYYSDASQYTYRDAKRFNGAEAGKAYSIIVANTPENQMILCSAIKATVVADRFTAIATVIGECGD